MKITECLLSVLRVKLRICAVCALWLQGREDLVLGPEPLAVKEQGIYDEGVRLHRMGVNELKARRPSALAVLDEHAFVFNDREFVMGCSGCVLVAVDWHFPTSLIGFWVIFFA